MERKFEVHPLATKVYSSPGFCKDSGTQQPETAESESAVPREHLRVRSNPLQKLCAFVLVFWTYHASGANSSLNLNQAVQYGLAHAPSVDSRSREVEIRRLELKNARAAFLPSLDLEAGQGLQRADTAAGDWTGGSDTISRLSLSLTENLFDNGTDWIRYKRATLALERAEAALEEERNKIALAVGTAFLDYSFALMSFDIEKEQHDLLSKQFQLVEAKYRQGLKTKSDYLRLNAQVMRSELRIQDARTAVGRSESELRRILGAPLGTDGSAAAVLEFAPLSLEDESLPSIPEVGPKLESQLLWQMSDLDRRLEELNVRLARREYGPRLYLTGGLAYHTDGYLDRSGLQTEGWSWNALATVRWNLWDWGTRRRDIAVAENNKEIAFNQVALNLYARRAEVEQMMLELKRVSEYLRVNRELLKLERQSYGLVESEYRNGKADYLELVTALSNLASARLSSVSAVSSLKKSLFQYQYYQGTLYGELASK